MFSSCNVARLMAISRTKATRIMTIVCMSQTVASGRLNCQCFCHQRGFDERHLVQALHHTTHRTAFQKKLIQQHLMRNVLADLAIEAEAARSASNILGRY